MHVHSKVPALRGQVTALASQWKKLLSGSKYKARDLIFSIHHDWNSGMAPTWEVEHLGFIGEDINGRFDSEERALEYLIHHMSENIKKEREVHQLAERCLST